MLATRRFTSDDANDQIAKRGNRATEPERKAARCASPAGCVYGLNLVLNLGLALAHGLHIDQHTRTAVVAETT